MLQENTSGFTLVELLVVITILAIISVVAYQNFGGAVDKAVSGRKISDLGTIETALQQFKTEKNFYPMPTLYSPTNIRGYNSGAMAYPSATLSVTYAGQEINTVSSGSGGGKVYGTGALGGSQIGAKGVVGYNGDFQKKYLSKDLYDPEVGDLTVKSTNKKLIDSGIGRYVYAVYALPKPPANWNKSSASASYYNIATSVKQKDGEIYESYILGDYSADSCTDSTLCPSTLIGTLSGAIKGVLTNGQAQITTATSLTPNQGIPYPVKDF